MVAQIKGKAQLIKPPIFEFIKISSPYDVNELKELNDFLGYKVSLKIEVGLLCIKVKNVGTLSTPFVLVRDPFNTLKAYNLEEFNQTFSIL